MITTCWRKYFLVTLILVVCSQLGCHRDKPTDSTLQSQADEFPDQEGWNSTIVSTNKGQVDAIIEYGHMARYLKKQIVHFDEGVIVDFYDTEGSHTSKLTAAGGVMNEKTNDVEAVGNVVVVSDSGVTLYTERLQWSQKTEKIISDVDVMITTEKGDTLYGNGFESDPELTEWTIKHLHGTAHRSVDLSTEKWKKVKKDSVTAEALSDSLISKDSTNVGLTDSISQTPELVEEKTAGSAK